MGDQPSGGVGALVAESRTTRRWNHIPAPNRAAPQGRPRPGRTEADRFGTRAGRDRAEDARRRLLEADGDPTESHVTGSSSSLTTGPLPGPGAPVETTPASGA